MANEEANKIPYPMASRFSRGLISLITHALMFALAWVLAFGVAYNFKFQATYNWFTVFCLPLMLPVVIIKLTVFLVMRLHRGWWRYVSLRDVFRITQGAWISFFIIFLLFYTLANLPYLGFKINLFGGYDFPDSVFLIDFVGTILLVAGARLAVRLYHEEVRPNQEGVAPRLLVLGAGNAGETVVREILRMPTLNYRVVGFLDDDPVKLNAQIHGIEVLGPLADVKRVCDDEDIDEILIAIPSATHEKMRSIIELCRGTNLRFKTLPAMGDLITGKAQIGQIRDVDINDLLGRAPVKLNVDDIAQFIKDRVVMVTGAGGSIGSEMCRQICSFEPRRLILAEQAEQNLFEIDKELRREHSELDIVPYIMDIGDAKRVGHIFRSELPTAVFHAAAHKHVPMMEYNPGEAIKNNVHGTRTIADAAVKHGCEKFVMISTDKAVNPTSIMGCSKRVAEMYIQGLNKSVQTEFITVRFGNVLGSSGSVIPIFREQIARGGPVTVTHPEMVRYFMTIPEAAQLVLQSASMGEGGEIFVLDMGEPVKIVDLARDLITLSGFQPEIDIPIRFVGMRPGEKLFEELAIDGEDVARTPHPKIGIWQNIPVDLADLIPVIERFLAACDEMDRDGVRNELKQIVPEFDLNAPAPPPRKTAAAAPDAITGSATANVAPA